MFTCRILVVPKRRGSATLGQFILPSHVGRQVATVITERICRSGGWGVVVLPVRFQGAGGRFHCGRLCCTDS
jgi:hypothetical protein